MRMAFQDAVSFDLSARQRATLSAICQTLLEGESGLEPTLRRAEALIASLPDPRDRTRLGLLLRALDLPLVNLVLSGRFHSLAALPAAERERVLRTWAFSTSALRRAGFQALKRLVHVAHYCWPQEDGSHAAWRAVGSPVRCRSPHRFRSRCPPLTSAGTRSSTATWWSAARARGAAWSRECWRRPARASWCWRRDGTRCRPR